MERVYHTFPVNNISLLKQQMLNWANRFNICCFLDNQHYHSAFHSYECLVGAGASQIFQPSHHFFASLSAFVKAKNDWLFGHFNYEIKNAFETISTPEQTVGTDFPDHCLFVPEVVLQLTSQTLIIGVTNQDANVIYKEIITAKFIPAAFSNVQMKPCIDRQEYLDAVHHLLEHIKKGDCYEMNFCQEFRAQGKIEPVTVYNELTAISPNPFSAYYKVKNNYLLCASPERYVKKEGKKIISQPIKGTTGRNLADENLDSQAREQLFKNPKERSENVMIVDLVRNDLSKICEKGTVGVDELFGIYSFPNLHHMISTITGMLKEENGFAEVLQATFPMGSMTGAPKKKVMELIAKYEAGKRGIYSGTVGYISPLKDFDFNVVIRSLSYNDLNSSLSFHVGSAITANSNAENEYEECLLKAAALMQVLENRSKP